MTRLLLISHSHAITLLDDPSPPAGLVEAVNTGRPASGSPVPPGEWFAFQQGDLVVVLPRSSRFNVEEHEKTYPKAGPLLPYLISPREREVMQGLVEGRTLKQIARRMGIGMRTVAAHLKNAKDKLGARTVEQSIGQAVFLGLVQVQPPADPTPEG
jgi:DNA-binding CsgD family transcriptional regulator